MRYLVMPRVVASLVMLPVLTIFADGLAILGGMVVANAAIRVSYATFTEGLRLFFYVDDVISGILRFDRLEGTSTDVHCDEVSLYPFLI